MPLVAFVTLTVLAWLLYHQSQIEVAVTVDGRTVRYHTHAGTVADLLVARDVPLLPGDLVLPPSNQRLSDGDRVVVQRARQARVRADGRTIELRTHGRSARAVLHEAGVTLTPGDRIRVNGTPWPLDRRATGDDNATAWMDRPSTAGPSTARVASLGSQTVPLPALPDVPAEPAEPGEPPPEETAPTDAGPLLPGAEATWTIDVDRAVPVTVVEDGLSYEMQLAGPTVGAALAAGGVTLFPEDELYPAADAPLEPGTRIVIHRATPFLVHVDGTTRDGRAHAQTVGQALAKVGVGLRGRDYAIPDAETTLTANLAIEVVRVVEDILVRELAIPFETLTEPDPSMILDERRVLQDGRPGRRTQRIRITYENGVETGREIIEDTVVEEPVPQRLAYGTQITWRTVQTPEGPKRYWRHMRVYATSYSASRAGTPKSVPWYGFTRLGWRMRHGIVAVDPRLIPLRTNLFVPGYGVGVAGDTGGGIRSYHIDLGFDDDNYESWHEWVDLYLLEPLPPEDEIRWILP